VVVASSKTSWPAFGREDGTHLDPTVVDVLTVVVTDQDSRVTAGCGT
jgi:hypothetical protein